MGLFDKVSTDGTGTTGTAIQSVKAFATLDLNWIFKSAGQAVVSIITNAISFFGDIFGKQYCNDQDKILVERFQEQIPGMMLLLVELGYYDESIGDWIGWDNQENIIQAISEMGRPHGANPCNDLIYPARLLLTILFGVRIVNSDFLDALDRGVDDYYNAGGDWLWDIPRNAVERAVMLKQQFFPISTYNREQWDLNRFQEFPLVAPIPDPVNVGTLYTGEFLGVKIVNGLAIGDPVPDIDDYTKFFDPRTGIHFGTGSNIDLTKLPGIPDVPTNGTGIAPGTGTTPGTDGDFFNRAISWAKAHPLETVGIIALVAVVTNELIDD